MPEINAEAWLSSGHRPMGFPEFVIAIASIMALNPLAMDMMLPALPSIGAAFNIADANHPQMVLSTFLIGFGVGQFVMGPLSDRFGRRPVLLGGMAVYGIASLLAIAASSFETLLLARALQGLGTSATRVIATSIVRDCYAGRRMASVMSLAMMVFIAVPVVAPSLGQAVLLLTQWRGIFVALMLYGVIALIWSALRMPETLPVEERKSLRLGEVLAAFRQTISNRQTLGYALACGGVWGAMFAFVFSSQQVFTDIYRLGHYFPLAFAAIATGVAIAGFLNSRIVGRLGMRVISHGALAGFLLVAAVMLAAVKLQMLPLPLFMLLSALMMFTFGLMMANFTALAMEPHGHIAGTASSLYGSITTLLGIGVGMAIGQSYDGTLLPFSTGFFLCALAALGIAAVTEKGRLFRPHHTTM
ncbi:Bcr/CflA family efflux MFS transporter [Bradyrhizobium neotropicale]|nr:multidrug effflux MFS transporter [Bradyrhizobium neotropicale]MBO4222204.1 Bcr/CflA family efflux MFS transporter [Bradyrhizobium neotropicale]